MIKWLQNLFVRKPHVIDETPNDMKYLIIGLGNIGNEYVETRHNIGFEIVDALAKMNDAVFTKEHLGDVAEFKHKGRSVTLLKPSTYMNLSGKAVRYWMQQKTVNIQNILVVHDDLNLPICRIRLRAKANDGGHNGLKSIDELLKTNEYARLRFGIGNNFPKGKQVAFVLGKWTNEEYTLLPDAFKIANEACLSFITLGITPTMTAYNKT